MMKKILMFALLLPTLTFAQKGNTIEIDKFTNQRRILSPEVDIYRPYGYGFGNSFGPNGSLYIQLRSVDTSCFIYLIASKGPGVEMGIIDSKDEAYLLLEDSSKVIIHSIGIQDYQISYQGNDHYKHQYSISVDDIHLLAQKKIIAIRIYLNTGYNDINIYYKDDTNKKRFAKTEKKAENATAMFLSFYTDLKK